MDVRAFSLAELIIGLLVLSIVGGAVAAVAAAVSRGWQAGEATTTANLTVARTMLRIQDRMQLVKLIGQWRAGSVSSPGSVPGAAILFWRDDDNGDSLMQLDETQLMEYDPATKNLLVWEPEFPDPATRAWFNGPFPTSMLTGSTAISDYKQLAYKRTFPIARDVLGMSFNVITPATASQRLTVEFQLKFKGPMGESVEYGTAAARAASA